MKLQPRLLAGARLRRNGTQAGAIADPEGAGAGALRERDNTAGANGSASGLSANVGIGLRTLGSELQQAAQQSTFEYPRNWVLVSKTAAALILMLALAHAGMTLIPMVAEAGNRLRSLISWTTVGVGLEVSAAALVAGIVLNLFPALRINPHGLGIKELTGWRTIPWKQIGAIRAMEVGGKVGGGRYLVMLPFKGPTKPRLPAPMLKAVPVLLGASREGESGVMITSDIRSFERLLQLVVSYLAQASHQPGPNVALEAFVDEEANMSTAQLLADPEAALERLAHYTPNTLNADPYGITEVDTDPPVNWGRMMLRQLPMALLPPLVLFADVLVGRGAKPWLGLHAVWAALLLLLGMAELPFVARLIQAVGELMVGGGKFKRAVWAYTDLQVPRCIAIVLGLAALGIGLPAGFAQALWLGGIALTTLLTTRFVQKLYYMPLAHTVLAALGTAIFQLSLLALYFGVK